MLFQNINLNTLTALELKILLNSIDTYVVGIEDGEYKYPDDSVYNKLQDFANQICDVIQSQDVDTDETTR